MAKAFKDLTEREVLALAVSLEEEDSKVYGQFADALRENYPTTARMFEEMRTEEVEHRRRLEDLYRERFGDHMPLVRRQDVKGFVERPAIWLYRPLSLERARRAAETMEAETLQFYERAAARTTDVSLRKLLMDLAETERRHAASAEAFEEKELTPDVRRAEEDTKRRLFVLQVVQPGLAGLMDGSVSTLAPLFAAAFATHNPMDAFRVGIAASVGAGISMGFAEALSDDGALTGRGRPLIRGVVCGLMTTAGGIGHTLPYLIPNFRLATAVAVGVVGIELAVISWIRHRFMDAPWVMAAIQVVIGGILVFIAGIVIGSS